MQRQIFGKHNVLLVALPALAVGALSACGGKNSYPNTFEGCFEYELDNGTKQIMAMNLCSIRVEGLEDWRKP